MFILNENIGRQSQFINKKLVFAFMFQRKYRMPQNLIFAVTKTTSFERKRRVVISISLETINQTNIYGADHYLDFRILRSGTASRYTEIHFLHNKCLSKKRNRPKKRPPNAKSSNANEVPPHSFFISFRIWICHGSLNFDELYRSECGKIKTVE